MNQGRQDRNRAGRALQVGAYQSRRHSGHHRALQGTHTGITDFQAAVDAEADEDSDEELEDELDEELELAEVTDATEATDSARTAGSAPGSGSYTLPNATL